ncbi:transposase [Methylovirgula sp. 4M-Z18]|uniref:transposase n=1 Tax=Methylovirgula sp. 4M-Z18 TaxID=2293567 RepID=UPI000E2FC6A8|nr:transposase [Methylovirgula sp. 4M-Z18]RFB78392.1 hypothetical protein DYH55_16760 [Methylovirgula sp. 4M-Z18]
MMAGDTQAFALAAQTFTPGWRTRIFPYAAYAEMAIALIEAISNAEIDHHLAYEAKVKKKNCRNGYWKRSIWSDVGEKIVVRMPRDRAARFEPLLIPFYRQHFYGFTDRILTAYAHGRRLNEFDDIVADLYDFQLPRDLAPRVIDAVLRVVREWQSRRLSSTYPVMLFSLLPTTVRERELTRSRPVHVGLGVRPDGTSELLGLWVKEPSGDDLWTQVTTDLADRGVSRISLVVTDEIQDADPCPHPALDLAEIGQCNIDRVCHIDDLKSLRRSREMHSAVL